MDSCPFEIDLDWEFDAPHWCDFTKEDNGISDDWFEKIEKKEELENQNSTQVNGTKKTPENTEIENKSPKETKTNSEKKHSKIPISTRRSLKTINSAKTNSTPKKNISNTENTNQNRIQLHSKIPTMRSSSKFSIQRQNSKEILKNPSPI